MVVVFLRGATNPPPDSWFTRVETWNKPVHEEGVFVTVPEEAEEALVFLAPETGGAFSTLRTAVRGKPGAFVRAAQDLRAGQSRPRPSGEISGSGPRDFHQRSRATEDAHHVAGAQPEYPRRPAVLRQAQRTTGALPHPEHRSAGARRRAQPDDGRDPDLRPIQRSAGADQLPRPTPAAATTVPILARSSMSPAFSAQLTPRSTSTFLRWPCRKEDQLNLRLNNPPSFRNPKSVHRDWSCRRFGRLRFRPCARSIAAQVFCAGKPSLLLPADGAPLVFATELAHNFVLHVETKSGPGIDLPAKPDPMRGGFRRRDASLAIRRSRRRSHRNPARDVGIPLFRWTALPPAHLAARAMDCRLQRRQRADRRPRRHAPSAVARRLLRERSQAQRRARESRSIPNGRPRSPTNSK